MSYQNMTREQYEILKQTMGPEEADKLVATFGTKVDGQPPMQNPAPPVGALAQAAPPQDDLSARVQAYEGEALRGTEDRFARQREAIEKMYGGPSSSDMLFALSRALLAPREVRGFAGTMANVTDALSGVSQARRSAEQKRAEALLNLESSYGKDTMGLRGESLDRQVQLAEYQAKQAEAARKAAEPNYRFNPVSGALMPDPGKGDNLGMLTPEQAAVAARDPRNKGKSFYTNNGVLRVIS